jgi:hypothetical protein
MIDQDDIDDLLDRLREFPDRLRALTAGAEDDDLSRAAAGGGWAEESTESAGPTGAEVAIRTTTRARTTAAVRRTGVRTLVLPASRTGRMARWSRRGSRGAGPAVAGGESGAG